MKTMQSLILLCFLLVFTTLPIFAEYGSASPEFLRTSNRNSSIGVDSVFFNPAATARLEDGLYLSIANAFSMRNGFAATSQGSLLNDVIGDDDDNENLTGIIDFLDSATSISPIQPNFALILKRVGYAVFLGIDETQTFVQKPNSIDSDDGFMISYTSYHTIETTLGGSFSIGSKVSVGLTFNIFTPYGLYFASDNYTVDIDYPGNIVDPNDPSDPVVPTDVDSPNKVATVGIGFGGGLSVYFRPIDALGIGFHYQSPAWANTKSNAEPKKGTIINPAKLGFGLSYYPSDAVELTVNVGVIFENSKDLTDTISLFSGIIPTLQFGAGIDLQINDFITWGAGFIVTISTLDTEKISDHDPFVFAADSGRNVIYFQASTGVGIHITPENTLNLALAMSKERVTFGMGYTHKFKNIWA